MDEPKVNYIQSQRLMNNRLDEAHIRSWRDKGFALVHDLLPQPLLAALKQDALAFYPEPNTQASERYNDFSSSQGFVFPSRSTAFNDNSAPGVTSSRCRSARCICSDASTDAV